MKGQRARPGLVLPRAALRSLALPLCMGLLLSAAAMFWAERYNQGLVDAELDRAAQSLARSVRERIERVELGLLGARALAHSHGFDQLSRSQYRAYASARNTDAEFPGVRGIGVIRRVPRAQAEAFALQAAADDWPAFRIRELTAHADEQWVIEFIEPVTRNQQAVGLDIASEPIRRQAALQALHNGRATLTAPITLVQATGKPRAGFLLLEPVFPPGALPSTAAERAALGRGWTYAPLVIHEVLAELNNPALERVALRIADRAPDGQLSPFYDSTADDLAPASVRSAFEAARNVQLDVAGRSWQVSVAATPEFHRSLAVVPPLTVAAAGAGASLLLTWALASRLRRRQLNRALNKERERRATVLQLSRDAIVQTDPQGLITDWNEGASALFGHAPHEALGRNLLYLLVPPDEQAHALAALARVQGAETLPIAETRRQHRDGHLLDVSLWMAALHDDKGQLRGMVLSMRDIGPAKAAKAAERAVRELNARLEDQVIERTARLDAALRESESLLHTVRTHAILSVTDRSGTILDANDNFCSISGYTRAQLVGSNHRIVRSGQHPREFWKQMWGTIARGEPWRGEICNRRSDGQLYWVDSMISPLRGPDGKIQRYLSIRFDISERKRNEQQLAEARERAEAANQAKSAFLANMSHEIRSPLAAILGLSHLLGLSSLDPEQRHTLQRLRLAGEQLLAHLNDVLDLAKVEAGELIVESEPFEPSPALQAVVQVLGVNAQAKGLPLSLELDPGLPAVVCGDRQRFVQIATNLLSNAIKFTAIGQVSLRLAPLPQGGLRLEVEDSGIGMDAATLARVFQPFVQADASTTRRFGGTGLGLSIVRSLAERLGGRVGAQSRLGQGSLLWAELPFAPCASPDAAVHHTSRPLAADALRGLHVLVVDDSDINRDVAQQILSLHGAKVTQAGDGRQALQQVDLQPPDAVLMDLHMPEMDGFEATRALRQRPGLQTLPVLAVTAGATAAEREQALAAGANAFVTKPYDPPQLMRLLLALCGREIPQEAVGAEPAGDAPGAPADPARLLRWSEDAALRRRFGESFETFLSMLMRLSEEPLQAWPTAGPPSTEWGVWRERAHRVRGVALNLGLDALADAAGQAESCLKAPGQTTASPALLWATLRERLDAVRQAAHQLPVVATAVESRLQAGGAPQPSCLPELLDRVEAGSLRSLDLLREHRDSFEAWLGSARCAELLEHLLQLRQQEALALLRNATG